jgi:hypothetical protein
MLALLLAICPAAALGLAVLVARRMERPERTVAVLAFGVFALSALVSPISYVHDHYTHFRHARSAWEDPYLLLDPWDRPAFMLLYAGAARFGVVVARLVSAIPASVAVAATMLAARAAGVRRAWLAGLFVAAQPDFFGQASSTMTELLLAAGLAVACWGFFAERPWLAAAGLAFGGIARPEAPLIVGVCALLLFVAHRRVGPLLVAFAPFVAYVALGSALHHDLLWYVHGNPYRGAVGLRIEARQILASFFYDALADGQPLPLLLLEIAGAALVLRRGVRRAAFLLGPVVVLWVLLTFLRIGPFDWWRQSRYLVSIAPILALLAATAYDALEVRLPRLAAPALHAAGAVGAGTILAKAWRPFTWSPGWMWAIFATPLVVAAMAWALRRRVPAEGALAAMLVAPLLFSPPGAFNFHRPTASERAAEHIVRTLAARGGVPVGHDHSALEPACAEVIGDPCPLALRRADAPTADDTLFVKQYDGTAPPPGPPEGWLEVWSASGPRIEGPLLSPVAWRTNTMIWERAPSPRGGDPHTPANHSYPWSSQ